MKFGEAFKASIKEKINGRQLNSPVFIKDFNEDNKILKEMNNLLENNPKNEYLKKDIALFKKGLIGERNVYFELINSNTPMICLHDITLQHNGCTAQFDYIVITAQCIYCLEAKNLNGDIEIDDEGNFYRVFRDNYNKIIKKEGFYNPVTQNQRHIELLKGLLISNKLIKTTPLKSIVVISNEKTVLDKDKAPKYIKDTIYRCDRLITVIKENDKILKEKRNNMATLEVVLYEIANFINSKNIEKEYNLKKKYSILGSIDKETNTIHNKDLLIEELRKYRLNKSNEEGIKPYMIYSNEELKLIIHKMPKSKEEFTSIKGFKEKKYDKYGVDIINIINLFNN